MIHRNSKNKLERLVIADIYFVGILKLIFISTHLWNDTELIIAQFVVFFFKCIISDTYSKINVIKIWCSFSRCKKKIFYGSHRSRKQTPFMPRLRMSAKGRSFVGTCVLGVYIWDNLLIDYDLNAGSFHDLFVLTWTWQ